MTASLTIELRTGGEAGGAEFLEATAVVSCRGFAGRTVFAIAARDLTAFVADVAALGRSEADLAQLVGGWDTAEERMRLRVTRAGTGYLLAVRVRFANAGARTDQWDRVETQFIAAPRDVSDFAAALALGRSASLAGDADSAA